MSEIKILKRNLNLALHNIAHPVRQLSLVQEFAGEFRQSEPFLSPKIFRRGEQVIRVVERDLIRQINN